MSIAVLSSRLDHLRRCTENRGDDGRYRRGGVPKNDEGYSGDEPADRQDLGTHRPDCDSKRFRSTEPGDGLPANDFASNMGVDYSRCASRNDVFVFLQHADRRERTAECLGYLEDFAGCAWRIVCECFEVTGWFCRARRIIVARVRSPVTPTIAPCDIPRNATFPIVFMRQP